MPLTALQKAKLLKRAPNSLGMFMFMQKFEQEYKKKVETLIEEFRQKLEAITAEVLETHNIMRKMQKGDRGEKGDSGIDSTVPGPIGPKGETGAPGRDSRVPGPIGDAGPQGEPGKDGQNGKDGVSPDKDEVAKLTLNFLKEDKFSVDDIEGLRNILNAIIRNQAELRGRTGKVGGESGGGGGGMGNWVNNHWQGDNSDTTFTLTYNVASNGTAIIVLLNGQVQEYTTHFTVSGKTLTFTTAPFAGAEIHALYVRK